MDEVAFRPCSIGGRRQEVWGDDDDGSCDYGPHHPTSHITGMAMAMLAFLPAISHHVSSRQIEGSISILNFFPPNRGFDFYFEIRRRRRSHSYSRR
jgi:hypothetical protein